MALNDFLEKVAKKIARTNDAATRVMVTAFQVSEILGRSGYHAASVLQRCERLVAERGDPSTGAIRIGDLMHEVATGSSKSRQPGAGTARMRAVLFKAVADWLSVAACSLCREESKRPGSVGLTWNAVQVEGEAFVVDVMFEPGALYEDGSGKAAEYMKRLQQECEEAASSKDPSGRRHEVVAAAPSLQQNLGGRMLRPSWHVEPWEVEFDRRDRAGRGGFGEVFQGTWAGQQAAVKEVRDASPTDADVCDFVLEISLLSRLSHPNVVRFWRGCVDLRGGHRTLLLVTEWMDRGVLSHLLHESQEPNLTMGQSLVVAMGVGRGVAYLHHVKILHLDLKSPNVLLNSSWQPKLCDFGLAKIREQTALQTTLRGVSPIWAPPEMFDDKAGGVTEKADVYSFGIIIFELATRKLPYADVGQMQLPRVKAKGQLPKFPPEMDTDLTELVRVCLGPRPGSRPPMTMIISKVKQLCKATGIDLEQEQISMEQRGLHFGGPGGSTPNVEQLRRAEAEKRRAEQEVARLRKLLEEEEARVRALQGVQPGDAGGTSPVNVEEERKKREFEDFCASRTQAAGEAKFRCLICRKLFRGPEFVHKHIRERHMDEFQPAANATPSQFDPPKRQPVAAAAADQFFDADVAEEESAMHYTRKFGHGHPGAPDVVGGFSQGIQNAAQEGDLAKLQQSLLQAGTSINQVDDEGASPLHLASKNGGASCVRYLLSCKADACATDEAGHTPVHLAAQGGHHEIVEFLVQAGAPSDSSSSAKQRTPLHLAAANGHTEVCRMLLLQKANVNLQDADGESPLHNAARFGDRELCELILSWGANVGLADNDGWCPIHEAARWGDGELVETLLQRGADPGARSNDGESALHVVPGGYAELEVVEVLLAWGCQVDSRDYDGETPLHLAVKLGDAELAGLLLQSGADANAASTAGATPLDFAKKDEVRWLLRSHKARKGTGAP
eukprot:TRINITY_DN29980_c0_g1_i1.p1 TRINITY_DN29980_c0_g1~~TRINITY_DN29980_c0_g1_i1.p1  ORF type:complete len:1061 (+),score=260.28 TRINITY_DN29980_c0_g1_i1:313-3183(+)